MGLIMVALCAVSSVNIAHALCGLPLISAETTTTDLPISGCYHKSPYMGLYETPVYTIEGRDVAGTGTKAILATNVSSPIVWSGVSISSLWAPYCAASRRDPYMLSLLRLVSIVLIDGIVPMIDSVCCCRFGQALFFRMER